MSEVFDSINRGLEEAVKFSRGNIKNARLFKPHPIDVKKLRERFGMTQPKFSDSFGISLATLRHWERGDRNPRGPALALLNLLSKDPEKALDMLNK